MSVTRQTCLIIPNPAQGLAGVLTQWGAVIFHAPFCARPGQAFCVFESG
jgi:hypothetical protein